MTPFGHKRYRFGRFLVALLLLVTVAGCGGTAQQSRHPGASIFRMNLGTEPPDLDPAKTDDLTSFTVLLPLMKGLTQLDAHMKPQPAMAQSWEVSPDGLRYTFHLRQNARWSDGKPVTADDFLFAWQRALTPATGAPYVFFLYELKNGKAYYEGKIKDFAQVGVHARDAHTLIVDLERPTPFFLDLAAAPVMLPLRRDVVTRYGERFTEARHFLSNGAYRMADWTHEEKIRLVPNPHFYESAPAKRPQVAGIDMYMINDANTSVVMYENNELDFIETTTSIPSFDVRRLRKSPDCESTVLHRINYFGFNVQKPPFNNPKVRQAFAYALDRSYYPRLMQSGQRPMTSWITPGLVGYNPHMGLSYNPQKARQLLAEAGYPDGKGFPTVHLSFQTLYDIQKEAEIAQYLWKKNLNVDVRLDNMEWKVLLSKLDEDPPQLFRLGWFVDYPDADSFMNVFLSDSGNNHTRWKNSRYDALVQQAVTTLNPQQRQRLYDQAQRLLLELDTAIIPVYATEKTYLVKPRFQGLTINSLNLPDFDQLRLKP
ncbi:peptide ABC transporter substrate-binding protein [Vampirovibrio chlorellavorus]|uniref:peptide ABC transporter substrate-binding protein n=1 Tax=Vampirovibrio chlorellavorus TaxID=758823 RepID=UPI0026ED6EED|nr:peptide ABC transporter substrate-binding protein [Vampirovibrio chlorellavorus]